ncbi:putative aminopeptidase W07G4.4 [Ischnura elegans]|uniref:putative aminopeptidase W07G4.4 n=1 Tax=Ischnura elegans TaxID=197161 RepID=UPI001ED8A64C|nr:putative aminopeptidase W07G4.4 [Ischnura elegans]
MPALPHVVPLKSVKSLNDSDYDGMVLVSHTLPTLLELASIKSGIEKVFKIDKAVETDGCVIEVNFPAQRLIYSPTGPLNRDYDDSRSYSEAASKGIARALKAGVTSPLLILPYEQKFVHADLVTLLGALEALYVPLQYREDCPDKCPKVKQLGVWGPDPVAVTSIINLALALEDGRCVSRDIGGGDPERMAPPKVEEYVVQAFKQHSNIKIKVIKDVNTFEKEYPLYAAVNRAANAVPRHQGRILLLEYEGEGPIDCTLMLVGKGVTYDTGGADIKAGGVMAGMSRDKCGAAAVAGFLKIVADLKPKRIKVIGAMAMVRNSVGEECYVADEIITSRAKVRVRIGNTDAEGRMAMADLLCQMKERAEGGETNCHIMTLATLTGHAVLTVGEGYSIVMDNGPARESGHAKLLQEAGAIIGDPFEISTIRREDFAFHKDPGEGVDVLQCNNLPSSRTPRGHQGPAAFLILASGLDKHGLDSSLPIKYSHLDIAASAGSIPKEATGSPVLALYAAYLEGRH